MKKQKGITFIGMLLTLIIVVMGGILVIRIVPMYIEHYSISRSISSLNSTPQTTLTEDPVADAAILRNNLYKRLEINGIYDFKESDITITPIGGNKFRVKVTYKAVKPLMFNMSLLVDFNDTQEVTIGSEN